MSRLFGRIMQNGFAVHDWRAAAAQWASAHGVGPFFAMEHIEFDWCEYRGEPVELDLSVGIAYSGDFQIELVQQHNDAPSIYADFLRDNPPGLQHVGALVPDLEATLNRHALDQRIVQQGRTTAGARFAYIDMAAHNGSMLELIESAPQIAKAFEYMRACAADWDGADPIRA